MPKPIQVPCPTCKKLSPYEGNPHRPFCSKRCRMIDLGSWANEGYFVEGKEESPSTSQCSSEEGADRDFSQKTNS